MSNENFSIHINLVFNIPTCVSSNYLLFITHELFQSLVATFCWSKINFLDVSKAFHKVWHLYFHRKLQSIDISDYSYRIITLGIAFRHWTKMEFSIKDFFNKSDQIRSFLRIWSQLMNKSLMENFIFCAMREAARNSTHRRDISACVPQN